MSQPEPYMARIKKQLRDLFEGGAGFNALWAYVEWELKRSYDNGKRWTYDNRGKEADAQGTASK